MTSPLLSTRWQEVFWALPLGEMRSKLRALEIDVSRMLRDVATCSWQPIETAPTDGTQIVVWHEEGLDICYWQEPQADGPDDMGHDGGWFGILYSAPGRSFGNPEYFRQAQGQPKLWMLPAPPDDETQVTVAIDNSDVVDQLRATQITMGQTCYPERDSWACLMESAACRIVTLESQLREAMYQLASTDGAGAATRVEVD